MEKLRLTIKKTLVGCFFLVFAVLARSSESAHISKEMLGEGIYVDNCGVNCIAIASLLLKADSKRLSVLISEIADIGDMSMLNICQFINQTGMSSLPLSFDEPSDVLGMLGEHVVAILHCRSGDFFHYVTCSKMSNGDYAFASSAEELLRKSINIHEAKSWVDKHCTGYTILCASNKYAMQAVLPAIRVASEVTAQAGEDSHARPRRRQEEFVSEWQVFGGMSLPKVVWVTTPISDDRGVVRVSLNAYCDQKVATLSGITGNCSCFLGVEAKDGKLVVDNTGANIRALFRADEIHKAKEVQLAMQGAGKNEVGLITIRFSERAYQPMNTFAVVRSEHFEGESVTEKFTLCIYEDAVVGSGEQWQILTKSDRMTVNQKGPNKISLQGRLVNQTTLEFEIRDPELNTLTAIMVGQRTALGKVFSIRRPLIAACSTLFPSRLSN